MKLIIAGSRTIFFEIDTIDDFIEHLIQQEITEVISGKASGMDRSGEIWADYFEIPIKDFPADWDQFGKAAGHIRNKEMAKYADALLLVWDGSSKGSFNMKTEMMKLGKPIHEVIIRKV